MNNIDKLQPVAETRQLKIMMKDNRLHFFNALTNTHLTAYNKEIVDLLGLDNITQEVRKAFV